ncbi:MAG: ferrochelatase [Chloroflexi bacterium]|nr:ferrochelatase [Chloroflexota bacterium]
MTLAPIPYDAVLLVSFGGPEGPDDVMPFLDNTLRGRNVPQSRKLEVARHYALFGGVSPINGQNRQLLAALAVELKAARIHLPLYWGNRNWHPLLEDTVRQMSRDGVRRALAFVTSAYSSYSGCRQYREDIERARAAVGPDAPAIDKVRVFYNHPLFVAANAALLRETLAQLPVGIEATSRVMFTAHSVPVSMAAHSRYREQLEEACRLVAAATGVNEWDLVFQSRSGPPQQPWLEPDVLDHLRTLKNRGVTHVATAPIGFVSDHLEVQYDLGIAARELATELGLQLVLTPTVGAHPLYVQMVRELIEERCGPTHLKRASGRFGPSHDVCPEDCCLVPVRPGAMSAHT